MDDKEKPKDYSPPGWLVYRIGNVVLETDVAQKLQDMRWKRVALYGKHDERCSIKSVLTEAFELLLLEEKKENGDE